MRLHRLAVTAIGPFADEQVIDLDRVSAGGLFLLEGPTGAGKSTLLDAITFALYGRTAGQETDQARLHSHHAAADQTPTVSLEFTVSGRRYRVTRVPDHERVKKRGSGVTRQKASATLESWSGGQWRALSTSAQEVGTRVSELLGLSRDQFTQVVLLPQGEFARFLSAGDDDRRTLLSRLFHVQDYDRLTGWLEDRARAARLAEQEADRALRDALTALAEGGRIDSAEAGTWLELVEPFTPESAARLVPALDAANARLSGRAATAARDHDELAAALRAAEARALEAAQTWQRHHDYEQLVQRRGDHRAGQDQWRRDRLRLERAQRAVGVAPLLARHAEDEARCAELLGRVPSALRECADADLEREAAGLATAARTAVADAAALGHLVEIEARLPDRRAEHDHLTGQIDEVMAARDQAEAIAAELPVRIADLEQRRDHLAGLLADAAEAEQDIPAAESRLAAAVELESVSAALAETRAAVQTAVDQHQSAVDAVQRLLQQRIDTMVADLAGRLVSGEPCEVCGSRQHPRPALSDASPTVSEVTMAAALEAREAAQERRERAEAGQECLMLRQHELQVASSALSADQARHEFAELSRRVAAAAGAGPESATVQSELATARRESEELAAATTERATRLGALTTRAEQLAADLRAEAAAVSQAAAGYGSVAARVAALEQTAQEAAAQAELLRDLAAARMAARRAAADARRAAADAGFDDLDDAASARLAESERRELAAAVQEWQDLDTGYTAQLADERFHGVGEGRPAELAAARAAADDAVSELVDQTEVARAQVAATSERAARFTDLRAQVTEALAERERLARDHAALVDLARLAAGKEPTARHRMTLTTYVLRRWFGDVVAAANQRLHAIAGGKYSLERCETSDRRSDRVGLGLRVFDHHTGRERSPASLSGGERFYTSLALALGLSDVVRAEAGGTGLDTLFVDEGFGSLDPVTLDEVLGVIDGLRDNGRVVGIVSHVAELKERIPERLEVTRIREDGPSQVRVVA